MRRRLGAIAASVLALQLSSLVVLAASPGTVTFTGAMLQFNPANGTKGDVTAGDNVMQDLVDHPAQTLFSFCWPGNTNVNHPLLTVVSDGSITGACSEGQEDVSSVPVEVLPQEYRVSSLAGTFDPVTSTVSFVMEGSGTQFASYELDGVRHPPVFRYEVTAEVANAPVVGNTATGMANFAYSCTPLLGGECGVVSATGTVEFSLLMFPVQPVASPTSGASASPTPSPSPSPEPMTVELGCMSDSFRVSCNATPFGQADDAVLEYSWTFDGATRPETGSQMGFDWVDAGIARGNHSVTVSVTDTAGTSGSASDSATVNLGATGFFDDPERLILLLILAGVSAAIIAAVILYFRRGRLLKLARDRARGGMPPGVAGAVGADRSGGFEDSLEYGEGAGTASPGSSKAYEALVVATSSQATAEEPLTNPQGEVADLGKGEEGDEASDEPAREGR